jgi:signal transduction histidine kinase
LSTLDAQTRMEQHAYDKGLSEVATSVLEELRNELLPIAVKMGRKRSLAANTTRANLAKATEELSDQNTESDRRQKLAQFVGTAMDRQFDQEAETWQDMQSIFARLEAIEDVLVERDRLAGANWVIEEVDLRDVIEQARAMMQGLTEVKLAVEIDLNVSDMGPVWADHFVLAHILRNLMLSSAQAIGRGAGRRGVINISVVRQQKKAGRRLADLRIHDNGCGIAPDALDGFLETGYQAEDGSAVGPRFDWCVSSLDKFNGTLSVESDGLDRAAAGRVGTRGKARSGTRDAPSSGIG